MGALLVCPSGPILGYKQSCTLRLCWNVNTVYTEEAVHPMAHGGSTYHLPGLWETSCDSVLANLTEVSLSGASSSHGKAKFYKIQILLISSDFLMDTNH